MGKKSVSTTCCQHSSFSVDKEKHHTDNIQVTLLTRVKLHMCEIWRHQRGKELAQLEPRMYYVLIRLGPVHVNSYYKKTSYYEWSLQ